MPTYHYRCATCNHEFDQFQRFSDDPLTDCPVCAGRVKRVIHNVGVVFKGSGWYITDSRNANGARDKGAASETATDSTKPAAKDANTDKPSADNAKSDAKIPAAN